MSTLPSLKSFKTLLDRIELGPSRYEALFCYVVDVDGINAASIARGKGKVLEQPGRNQLLIYRVDSDEGPLLVDNSEPFLPPTVRVLARVECWLREWWDALKSAEAVSTPSVQHEGREGRHGETRVMPSAAKSTTGAGEGAKLPGPEPYPVMLAGVAPEVVGLFRPGTPSVILTNEDRYILTVLDAHRGTALTYDQIANESVRMNRENPKKIKRLSDSAIRKRVPVLEALALVARPPGTEKKGIAITDSGHAAINYRAETQRKPNGK